MQTLDIANCRDGLYDVTWWYHCGHLAAGENGIRLGAPHIADLDAVDIDAIHVVSAGKGVAPVVPEPRAIAGDGGRK